MLAPAAGRGQGRTPGTEEVVHAGARRHRVGYDGDQRRRGGSRAGFGAALVQVASIQWEDTMAKADGSLVKALRALKHEIRMLRAEHKADLAQLRRQYRAGIKRLTRRS